MSTVTTTTICSRCGWPMDEIEDCYCAGCGRCLRQLRVGDGEGIRTLFFPSRESHVIPLENVGDHELTIDVMWEFVGLHGLTALIDGSSGPRVTFLPKESKMIEIRFSGDALPSYSRGTLRVKTGGINPPLEIPLLCSPLPRFYITINGTMARGNRVKVVSPTPEKPDLDFEIDLQGASLARWIGFNIYPDADASQSFPLPADILMPVNITGDKGLSFRLKPELARFVQESGTTLTAEFRFMHCQPVRIGIEILKEAVIKHRQDEYLIDEKAIIRGSTTPIEIRIEMKNAGGIPAEILTIRSLCPQWLEMLNTPDQCILEPGGGYTAYFTIRIDPPEMELDGPNSDGKIEVAYVAGDNKQIHQKILNIPIEIRDPISLRHALAIDFGNTSTCVASFDERNQLQVISLDPTFPNTLEFPTIIEFVRFQSASDPEIGEGFRYGVVLEQNRYAAVNNYLHRTWAFKSGIGAVDAKDVTRIDIENKASRTFTFEDLSRFYLSEVLNRFEERSGSRTGEAIITYPASFSRRQIDKLRSVALAAMPHIQVTAEISEPEALALNYFRNNPLPENKDLTFAVFDFGGGTTDISIGRIQSQNGYQTITILVSIGLDWLGGEALTFRIARDIYAKACEHFDQPDPLFPEYYTDIFTISGVESQKLVNFMHLMDVAEGIKTNKDGQLDTLYKDGELSVGIRSFHAHRQGGPQFCVVKYAKEDFDKVARKKISQGIQKLSDLFFHLQEYQIIEALNLDFIILGGNSARLPLVKEMLIEQFALDDDAIYFDPLDAKTAVAKGAAYYGRLRKHPDATIIFDNAPRLKYPLGILDWEDRFKVVFPAGSKIGHDTPIAYTFRRITAETELAIHWNQDPSDMNGHSGAVHLAATHSLARYSTKNPQPVNFSLRLVDEGIQLWKDTGKQNLRGDIPPDTDTIPIEF